MNCWIAFERTKDDKAVKLHNKIVIISYKLNTSEIPARDPTINFKYPFFVCVCVCGKMERYGISVFIFSLRNCIV